MANAFIYEGIKALMDQNNGLSSPTFYVTHWSTGCSQEAQQFYQCSLELIFQI